MMKSSADHIGYSTNSIEDAIDNALQQAVEYSRYEVIEYLGEQNKTDERQYKVTLKTFLD